MLRFNETLDARSESYKTTSDRASRRHRPVVMITPEHAEVVWEAHVSLIAGRTRCPLPLAESIARTLLSRDTRWPYGLLQDPGTLPAADLGWLVWQSHNLAWKLLWPTNVRLPTDSGHPVEGGLDNMPMPEWPPRSSANAAASSNQATGGTLAPAQSHGAPLPGPANRLQTGHGQLAGPQSSPTHMPKIVETRNEDGSPIDDEELYANQRRLQQFRAFTAQYDLPQAGQAHAEEPQGEQHPAERHQAGNPRAEDSRPGSSGTEPTPSEMDMMSGSSMSESSRTSSERQLEAQCAQLRAEVTTLRNLLNAHSEEHRRSDLEDGVVDGPMDLGQGSLGGFQG